MKMKKGIRQLISDLWYGKDKNSDDVAKTTELTPQNLQDAVAMKMQAANAKGDAASAQMVAAQNARVELGKLVIQHDELEKQALIAEKSGNNERAKKLVALKLAIKAKIEVATERYEQTNKIATQLVQEARTMFREAKEASDDLPRKVMQLEVNRMLENAAMLEGKSQQQLEGKPTYEALTASIDIQTQRLLVRGILEETGDTMDGEIEQVLKEAEFEKEYKLLQAKAKSGEDVIDAEYFEEGASEKARRLLAEPAFGGLLPGIGDSFTIKREPVRIKVSDPTKQEDKNE